MEFYKFVVAVIYLYYYLVLVSSNHSYNDNIDLPESHLPYYFNNFPQVIKQCLSNNSCIHQSLLKRDDYNMKKCWGYEQQCTFEHSFSVPKCAAEKPVWIKTKEDYINTFYEQADFGKSFIITLIHGICTF